jgi:NSS family neurotransmitter:Na+ symporter
VKRQRWGSRWAFILAAVGSAAGLGNAWRFPYKAYTNGGGAFYIPYFIALFVAGIPLLMAEFAVGQSLQSSAPKAMAKINKKVEFIGWWGIVTSSLVTFYYSVIMGWIFNYLIFSFNVSWKENPETFFLEFLQRSSGPGEIGNIVIPVAIGLAITWLFVYIVLRKGTESVGKVVLWTVPLPIILLIILGIRGFTLEGASTGLDYLFNPSLEKLSSPSVWAEGFGQIFYSLSVAFGIMIAYGSFNKKKQDIANNAIITALGNSATSFLAAIAVFSVLGYMANVLSVKVPEVVTGGIGLAFVTYPQAIALLPGGIVVQAIFGFLFFVMLLTLGIDSVFSLVEAIESSFSDKFNFKKKKFLGIFMGIGFIMGLFFSTQGGIFWLDIFDHFLGTYALLMVGIFETIIFGWVMGAENIRDYINEVSEIKIGKWFNIAIKYIIPIVLSIIFVNGLIDEIKNPYENYPTWSLIIGFMAFVLTPLIALIFSMLKAKNPKEFYKKEKIEESLKEDIEKNFELEVD